MITSTRQLYFEGVKVGDELPPLVKPPVDRLQIARYVAAAADWNPLYIDEPHARAAGFPSAFAPGTIGVGFIAELAADWTRGASLKKLQSRMVKFIWPGDVLTARGRVVERRFEPGDAYGVDLELWAENQRGELVTRGLATYRLFYSAEDEARQRAGQPPLHVTQAEEEARLARLSRAMPQRPAVTSRPLQPARPIGPPPAPPLPRGSAPKVGAPAGQAARKPAAKAAGKRPAPKAAAKRARPAPKAATKRARPAAKRRPARSSTSRRRPSKAARKPARKTRR